MHSQLTAPSLLWLQKIKVLHRSLEAHLPESLSSTAPISRNLDPALHPFARPREYTRAVTAAKLERMFSKPFVASLEGHGDGLYSMAKDESGGLSRIASGSGDGEVRLWDLGDRRSVWDVVGAHKGMVTGVAFSHPVEGEEGRVEKKVGGGERGVKRKRTELGDKGGKGKGREEPESDEEDMEAPVARGSPRLLTCGSDKTVKLWDLKGARGVGVQVRFFYPVHFRSQGCSRAVLFSFSLCKPTWAKPASSTSFPLALPSLTANSDPSSLKLRLSPSLRPHLRHRLLHHRNLGRDQDFATLDPQVPLHLLSLHRRTHCLSCLQQE